MGFLCVVVHGDEHNESEGEPDRQRRFLAVWTHARYVWQSFNFRIFRLRNLVRPKEQHPLHETAQLFHYLHDPVLPILCLHSLPGQTSPNRQLLSTELHSHKLAFGFIFRGERRNK